MDPIIWQRLPLELIVQIIQQCDDETTLKSWLAATIGQGGLHGAALGIRYSSVAFGCHEIIPTADDFDEARTKIAGKDRESSAWKQWEQHFVPNTTTGLIKQLATLKHGLRPASFIRSLEFDFGTRNEYPVTISSIEHTIGILIPHLVQLTTLEINCYPADVFFSSISSIGFQIRRLSVNSDVRASKEFYYRSPLNDDTNSNASLNWIDLKPFPNLHFLSLTLTRRKEWSIIPGSLVTLKHLRALLLSTLGYVQFGDITDEAVGLFKDVMFTTHTTPGIESSPNQQLNLLTALPSSLRKLTLQDFHYQDLLLEQFPPALLNTTRINENPKITDLCVDLNLLDIPKLLTWLPAIKLTRLSLAAGVVSSVPEHEWLDQASTTLDDIMTRFAESLEELILRDAWEIHPDLANHFNARWDGQFSITDVILSTWAPEKIQCRETHERDQLHPKNRRWQKLKHMLFGCSLFTGRWGSNVLRIRLELPCAAHEDLDTDFPLGECDLPLLRVLIVSPRSTCAWETVEESRPHGPIIQNIAKNAIPSLRYFSVCSRAYWIDHGDAETEINELNSTAPAVNANSWTAIPWMRAIGGADQGLTSIVQDWLTKDDRVFIDSESLLNSERSIMQDNSEYTRSQAQPNNLVIARKQGI